MADLKITALTANTTLVTTDVLPIVDDPGGTPATQKTTFADVDTLLSGTTKTLTNKTLTAPNLSAGTASAGTAPLKYTPTAAVLLSSPVAGAAEVDSNGLQYYTHATSSRGVAPAVQFVALSSAFTLSAASGVQSCLPSASDVFTFQATTTYEMEGFYTMTTGATTHTTAIAFALGGSGSVTSFIYNAQCWSGAANTIDISSTAATAVQNVVVSGVASKVLNLTSTAVETNIRFHGFVRFNVAGTLTPQINFSANPTGTNTMNVGSWIKFTPYGTNTVITSGNWA